MEKTKGQTDGHNKIFTLGKEACEIDMSEQYKILELSTVR